MVARKCCNCWRGGSTLGCLLVYKCQECAKLFSSWERMCRCWIHLKREKSPRDGNQKQRLALKKSRSCRRWISSARGDGPRSYLTSNTYGKCTHLRQNAGGVITFCPSYTVMIWWRGLTQSLTVKR